LARTVKRTGFSAPGDKSEEFAESGERSTLSGSHRVHKGRHRRESWVVFRMKLNNTDCVAERGRFEPPVPPRAISPEGVQTVGIAAHKYCQTTVSALRGAKVSNIVSAFDIKVHIGPRPDDPAFDPAALRTEIVLTETARSHSLKNPDHR